MKKNFLNRLGPHLLTALKNGFGAWVFVVKLTIPAMILTRLLLYFDLIPYVAAVFEPLMKLLGLPAEGALVWVASMLANVYVGVTVYVSLSPIMEPWTLAQITTMGAMILLAHSLIVEGAICGATGLSFWRVTAFRLISAFLMGLIIHLTALMTGWGAEPSALVGALNFSAEAVPPWGQWALASVQQLFMILFLVEGLMLLMELIKYLGLTRLLAKVLGPPLRFAGVGERALMVTVIGCVVGLGYGGGLIIAESRSGNIAPRDIFGAVMLMSVFHSMFEDTLVMWFLGGSPARES